MYPENPEGTQVIVGSMNMGYISDTARNQTHNLFRSKCKPIPPGHSDGLNPIKSDPINWIGPIQLNLIATWMKKNNKYILAQVFSAYSIFYMIGT